MPRLIIEGTSDEIKDTLLKTLICAAEWIDVEEDDDSDWNELDYNYEGCGCDRCECGCDSGCTEPEQGVHEVVFSGLTKHQMQQLYEVYDVIINSTHL